MINGTILFDACLYTKKTPVHNVCSYCRLMHTSIFVGNHTSVLLL